MVTKNETCNWTEFYAYFLCLLASSTYVLALYFLVPIDVKKLPREDPTNIKWRLQAVTIAKAIIFIVAYFSVPTLSCLKLSYWDAFGLTINFRTIHGLLVTAFLMSIFYLGEVIGNIMVIFHAMYNVRNKEMRWELASEPKSLLFVITEELQRLLHEMDDNVIMTIRNIVFAPISEELVFRGIIVTSIYTAYIQHTDAIPNISAYHTAWASIGWFGLAHLHHMLEKMRNGETFVNALKVSLLQLVYTSIFGYIAALLFVRTGSIYPPILSHMICNFVGLPDMGFMQPPPNHYHRMGCNYSYRYVLLVLHIMGLILFSFLLFPCTEGLAKYSYFYNP